MIEVGIEAPDVRDSARDLGDLGAALGTLEVPSRDAAALALGAVVAPRDTGTLDDSVEAVVTPLGFTLTAGGTRAPYAAIVHARDPFLTRALDARAEDVVGTYADHVDDTIAKHI